MEKTKGIIEPIMEEKAKETDRTSDAILIGYDCSLNKETAVLIVGRKRENQSVEIINAFDGKEATEMYNKLLGK